MLQGRSIFVYNVYDMSYQSLSYEVLLQNVAAVKVNCQCHSLCLV